jgi:hypothetical protein
VSPFSDKLSFLVGFIAFQLLFARLHKASDEQKGSGAPNGKRSAQSTVNAGCIGVGFPQANGSCLSLLHLVLCQERAGCAEPCHVILHFADGSGNWHLDSRRQQIFKPIQQQWA